MKKILALCMLLVSMAMVAQNGWVKQTVTATSGTITVNNTQQDVIVFHNANTLAVSLTLAFPATPRDGQIVIFCSKNGVTSLSLTTTVGQIIGLLTTITITTPGCWVWFADLSMWVRIR